MTTLCDLWRACVAARRQYRAELWAQRQKEWDDFMLEMWEGNPHVEALCDLGGWDEEQAP